MESPPFEDVFPIENGDIPASYVSLPEGISIICILVLNAYKIKVSMYIYSIYIMYVQYTYLVACVHYTNTFKYMYTYIRTCRHTRG